MLQNGCLIFAKIGSAIVANGHFQNKVCETVKPQLFWLSCLQVETLAMAVSLLAIGLAGAQLYAPAPAAPVQYTSAKYPIAAQPYEAQPVYVAA